MLKERVFSHPDFKGLDFEDLVSLFWNRLNIGVALIDKNDRIVAVNPKFADWLAYPPTELVGKTWMDITIHTDIAADSDAISKIRSGQLDEYTMAKVYTSRNNDPVPGILHVIGIKSDNNLVGFFAQIERADARPMIASLDELRVLWNFLGRYKKTVAAIFIGVALAGQGAIEWMFKIASIVPEIIGRFSGVQ